MENDLGSGKSSFFPQELNDFRNEERNINYTCEDLIKGWSTFADIITLVCEYTYLSSQQVDLVKNSQNQILFYYCHDLGDLVKIMFLEQELIKNDFENQEFLCERIKLLIIHINQNRSIELSKRKAYINLL